MARARPSQAVIRNAILAARDCGLEIGAVEITREGGARILVGSGMAPLSSRGGEEGCNTCDELFRGTSS
jgi:hypothetical protein